MATTPAQKAPPRTRRPQPRAVTFQPPTPAEEDEAMTIAAKKAAARKHAAPSTPEPQPALEPAIDDVDDEIEDVELDDEPEKPTPAAKSPEPFKTPEHIGGVKVTREQLFHNLSPDRPFRYSRLHLADDTSIWACRDCWATGKTRGEIMQHRNAAHGSRYGQRRSKASLPVEQGVLDLVLEPRADGTPVPNDPLDWTLRELLAMMPTIGALGDLIERVEYQRDKYRDELASRTTSNRDDQHKIDVYEAHRAELLDLRKFKRDTIKKFEQIGFKFNEED